MKGIRKMGTYQGFGYCDKALHIKFVLAEIQDLQSTVPFEDLGEIRNTCLNSGFNYGSPKERMR